MLDKRILPRQMENPKINTAQQTRQDKKRPCQLQTYSSNQLPRQNTRKNNKK